MLQEIAFLSIQPGREAEFEAIFAKRRQRVLAEEPETTLYDLYRADTPGLYVVYEFFASDAAKDFHLKNSTDHGPMMACFSAKPYAHRLDAVDGACGEKE